MKNIITKDIEYMKYVLGYKRGVVISEQQSTEGCIKGNCENGKGTMKYANGSVYTGQWKDGAKNGQGTYKNINGKTFSGNWVDGELDGKDMSILDEIKPSNAQSTEGCIKGNCVNGILYVKNIFPTSVGAGMLMDEIWSICYSYTGAALSMVSEPCDI